MTFKDINAFNLFIAEMNAECGLTSQDGWINYHNDGSITFVIADMSVPYGC
jgi:hypothetical protein